ncbi:TonB-dependent receptor plug domain-containing protein [Klebsiella pneumoniae]|uniref:TonB-dependent receptor plug domain-containing protein n=1 Tax=Klebsiella pneumoniae TaxID=573 RepID=A0A927DTA3_KLEPN|nr:TonB-dependent receptor plug domain-containing protein [Klebsiella pneumoniae]
MRCAEAAPRVNLSESLGAVPGLQVQNRQNYARGSAAVDSRLWLALNLWRARTAHLCGWHSGHHARRPGQTSNIDIGSVDTIEVLRGPFSALYGNSSGGVINVTSQTGTQPPTVEASSYYGSFGTGTTG